MAGIRFEERVRKVENRLAVLIPSEKAREAGLRPGTRIVATIETQPKDAFGAFKNLGLAPFRRAESGLWRDRI